MSKLIKPASIVHTTKLTTRLFWDVMFAPQFPKPRVNNDGKNAAWYQLTAHCVLPLEYDSIRVSGTGLYTLSDSGTVGKAYAKFEHKSLRDLPGPIADLIWDEMRKEYQR